MPTFCTSRHELARRSAILVTEAFRRSRFSLRTRSAFPLPRRRVSPFHIVGKAAKLVVRQEQPGDGPHTIMKTSARHRIYSIQDQELVTNVALVRVNVERTVSPRRRQVAEIRHRHHHAVCRLSASKTANGFKLREGKGRCETKPCCAAPKPAKISITPNAVGQRKMHARGFPKHTFIDEAGAEL